jgi:hypothetical protein
MNWNLLELVPCPARGKFVDSMLDDPAYGLEEKFDGDRRTGQFYWQQGDHGFQTPIIHFAGRRFSDIDGKLVEKGANVPHITRAQVRPGWGYDSELMERMLRLTGTMLDGECILPEEFVVPDDDADGGKSKYVTKVMGSKPERAIELQVPGTIINGRMRWKTFDILFYMGRDLRQLPLSERRKWLIEAVSVLRNPFITVAEQVVEGKREALRRILDAKGEGAILKQLDQPYDKHLTWAKKKVEMNADVVILGFEPPEQFSKKVTGEVSETKFWKKGWVGAIQFGQYRDGKLWPCGTASGMSDKLRAELSTDPQKFIGRVVEIKANGREPTGAFRHPRFKNWRDDKVASDCVYNPNET